MNTVLTLKPVRWLEDVAVFVSVGDRQLAPIRRREGCCVHVTADGEAAYTSRFDALGPFVHVGGGTYLAAARLGDSGFHIGPDGTPTYDGRFAYVGDFERVGARWLAHARLKQSAVGAHRRRTLSVRINPTGKVIE